MKKLCHLFLAVPLWAIASLAMPSASQTIAMPLNPAIPLPNQPALVEEFRRYYYRLQTATQELVGGAGADSVVLERLGDQLDVYRQILSEVWILCFAPTMPTLSSIPISSPPMSMISFDATLLLCRKMFVYGTGKFWKIRIKVERL